MNYTNLAKKTISIFYRKIRTAIKAPIVEIETVEVFDRLGQSILEHDLLDIFKSESPKFIRECYEKYVKFIMKNQNGKWLERLIGKEKEINYWITPWGGGEKRHGEKYLSNEYLANYSNKVLEIKNEIAKNGYHPEKFGYITGQLLIDENGRKRFIIWNGHKRVLCLAGLGYKKFKVEVSGGDRWNGKIQNHIVKISEIDNWINVKNGLYSKREAVYFFRNFFK